MSKDIENMVLKCSNCLKKHNANSKEPLMSHEVPERPWQVVASDLFSWEGQDFLTIVDYYSKYFEVYPIRNTLATTVIHHMKLAFSHHGVPEKLISDNGLQYASKESAKFSKQYGFVHATSSPKHAQSNGLAEKTVQTVKHTLAKCKADHKDLYLGILEYLNTPLEAILPRNKL
jgi:transposase InsO family protein